MEFHECVCYVQGFIHGGLVVAFAIFVVAVVISSTRKFCEYSADKGVQ